MNKQHLGRRFGVVVALCFLLIACVVAIVGYRAVKEQKLVKLQNSALEELERNKGTYDEQSIVLSSTSRAKAEELAELFNAELRITKDGRFARLTLPEGTNIRDIYANDDYRIYIEDMSADYEVYLSDVEEQPNETNLRLPQRPQYTVSDSDYYLQTYLDYLNLKNTWEYSRGGGVTVAVIDTGIDTDHPEFASRISKYSYNASLDKVVFDYVLENGEYDWSLIEDEQGHGTAVSGVIAASMNAEGVVGIAPEATILVIKAECNELGAFKRSSDLIFGIYYAIERDVQVINMSFGSSTTKFTEPLQLAYDSDIICVAAAGNSSTAMLTYPASNPYVIGVGAIDENWSLTMYSNYGENSDLVAPGSTYTAKMGGGYEVKEGTSFASPIVAGTIALYMQNNMYQTVDMVKEILFASCYDLGQKGNDWQYGFGALDADAFLREEKGKVVYDMLSDELEDEEGVFVRGHALQEYPEPERLYAVFDGWYYDSQFTCEVNYYEDAFTGDLTLYAKWVNEEDGIPFTYVILDDGTVEIRSYTGHRRYITIPEKIEGRVVSSIGDFAFAGQSKLREVSLPSGLSHIGMCAFSECSNLLSISIPDNVKTIGEGAFEDNIRLATVAISGNSKLSSVGNFCFKYCSMLEEIELPEGLSNINGSAFLGATALYEIQVSAGNPYFVSENGVLFTKNKETLVAYPAAFRISYRLPSVTKTIGQYAFAFSTFKSIDLKNVTFIADGAFFYSSLTKITLPDTLAKMGESVFVFATELAEVTIGHGLSTIPVSTFKFCSKLKQITIPNTIACIEEFAFGRSGIQKVQFEKESQLVSIGVDCFSNTPISEIVLPASLEVIGANAFASAINLKSVMFEVGSKLLIIGDSAFEKCYSLTSVDLPQMLMEIGEMAFAESGISEVYIPESVCTIGSGAFALCSNLNKVQVAQGNAQYDSYDGVLYTEFAKMLHTYPAGKEEWTYTVCDGVSTIGAYAFAGARNLHCVILPTVLTDINDYAFYRTRLYNIEIPDEVTHIGRYSFAQSWELRDIYFGVNSKLPRIGFAAFAQTGLHYFTVPQNVRAIAQEAFMECKQLTHITFAENSKLESISAYMFKGCENLESLTFLAGSQLKSIQAHGLEGMYRLSQLDFSQTKLANIDNFAFRFCLRLTDMHIPEGVTSVGRYAFYGCESLSQLTLPASVEHIGSFAFLGTKDMDLYFTSDTMPTYLDENWDHAIRGYYVGVTEVITDAEFRYAKLTSGNVAIIEYLGNAQKVDLTRYYFGAPITAIGGSAFEGSSITSIVLPESLLEIQAKAFLDSNINEIQIPKNVTYIGREAFANTALKEITFAPNSKLNVIEQYAFEGCEKLRSISLPKSLSTIGSGAFIKSGLEEVIFQEGIGIEKIAQKTFANTKLTSVTLPDSVVLVDHNAFSYVNTLKSVNFGKNDGIRLESNAFYQTGLSKLNIPENITYIGEYCFVALGELSEFAVAENNPYYKAVDGLLLSKDGRKLIAVPAGKRGSLTVPLSVEFIGFGAFEESKLGEVKFYKDANILSIGYRAFFGAGNLTSITIPASVVSIDYYAFAYCNNLKEVIVEEGSRLKGIYEGAFCSDGNLKNIVLPESIVEISDFAFYGCSKITKLPIENDDQLKGIYSYAFAYTGFAGEFTLPESVLDVGDYAFIGTKLTKVTIPEANKKQLVLGIGVFEDCKQMKEITLPFLGASYENEDISWFGYIFGAGSYEANETYVPKSLKTVTLTDGITTIYTGGFYRCTGLETINVPHSVSVLWNYAFGETTARYELTNTIMTYYYGEPITSGGHFGQGVFGEIKLSGDIIRIGDYTFHNCNNITAIDLPESVEAIGDIAFCGCERLTSIVIPDSVTEIGWGAFCRCTNLKDVVLPKGLATISYDMFNLCTSLTTLKIPSKVTSIERSVFSGCTNLESVILPDSVTEISDYAFFQCSKLRNIELPKNLVSIGEYAFYKCFMLSKIILPNTVVSLEHHVFSFCTNLTDVTLSENLTAIPYEAFRECTSLSSIIIPESVKSISDRAFEMCDSLHEVKNYSNLSIELGSNEHGGVAYFAKVLLNRNGDKLYKDDLGKIEYIETKDGFRFVKEYDSYTLIAYLGEEDTVSLPTSINGQLYEIYQFRGGVNIIIPEGFTSISEAAFRHNKSIRSVHMPDSVTTIGDSAFFGCNVLESIELPCNLETIDNWAFGDCEVVRSIKIPDSVKEIGTGAFANCYSLQDVQFPKQSIDLDTSIFRDCVNLKNVVLPENISTIPNEMFRNCTSLTAIIIPQSVEMIFHQAFSGCTNLASIEFSENINYIDGYAFEDCKALRKIELPENLTWVGSHAFAGCSNLEEVSIPANVSEIGAAAFTGCDKLSSFNIDPNNEYCILKNDVIYNKEMTNVICVLGDVTKIVLPDGITSIANSMFEGCTTITEIVIPEGVNYIGVAAFDGCTDLKKVVIPSTVTYIGRNAFRNCTSLKEMTLPKGIQTIEFGLFWGCTNLEKVNIPKTVTKIDMFAFESCSNLKEIDIPISVTYIGNYAFERCYKLEQVDLPDAITDISAGTFYECTSLKNVKMPSNLISIGFSAFMGCSSLEYIDIPKSVTLIEECAFQVCTSLNNVVIPEGVQSIERWIFGGCTSLTSIQLPKELTRIGEYAFYDSGLLHFDIPDGIKVIERETFSNCFNMTSLSIPKSIQEINEFAFNGCSSLYHVRNNSSLPISIGSADYGEVALNAVVLVNKNGEKIYRNDNLDVKYIDTEDGFLFKKENNQYYLFAYVGREDKIVLPNNVNGNDYNIYYFRGPNHVVIPEGCTHIGDYAFYNSRKLQSVEIPNSVIAIGNYAFDYCVSLRSVDIPDSVRLIGAGAFTSCQNLSSVNLSEGLTTIEWCAFSGCTNLMDITIPSTVVNIENDAFSYSGISENQDNWKNGLLIVDGWLVEVAEDVQYIKNDGSFDKVANGAYKNCYQIKNPIWDGLACEGATNAETVIVSNMCGNLYRATNYILTIKNVVILSTVTPKQFYENPYFFANVSGITIFVEGNKDDLRLDDNFPGWNNGNRVVYSENWSWLNYYDGDGQLIYSAPRLNSAVIRQPILELPTDYAYGWDIDGDGVIDSIPATSITDIYAKAIVYRLDACENNVHIEAILPAVAPTNTLTGLTEGKICGVCGKILEAQNVIAVLPKFAGASAELRDNIALRFKVDAKFFGNSGYTNPYVVFSFNGKEYIIRAEAVLDSNGRYQFVFANIAPSQMGVEIYATLYASYNGEIVACQSVTYSVKDYCYSMLNKYAENAAYGKLNTLLVDLLYYGEAAQIYTDYMCDALVTKDLSDAQKAWKTKSTPALSNNLNSKFQTVATEKATWKGAGLVLQDSVCVRFKLSTNSIAGLSVVIETENGIKRTIKATSFEKTDGGYYVYFKDLNAGQMRDMIYATVYEGGQAVSNTLAYSIESYAASKTSSGSGTLVDLLYAMMQYGDAAAKYAGIA